MSVRSMSFQTSRPRSRGESYVWLGEDA